MRFNYYKILLHLLKGATYLKRGLIALFSVGWRGALSAYGIYYRILGFRLYKLFFSAGKIIGHHTSFFSHGFLPSLGQRAFLQIFLLIILLFIAYPHSKLYGKEHIELPGRQSLLYKLVGPGDQDFQLDEASTVISADTAQTEAVWGQGAVTAQPETGAAPAAGPQDIAGISSGGSALTKPVILPGVDVSAVASAEPDARSGIVLYEVQPGDIVGNIATSFGVSIETILWANGLSARSYIRPGDILKILPKSGVLHKVARGDTVLKIAKKYDTDADEIVRANKLQKDGSDIVVGEELLVPGGRVPRPVYVAPRQTSQFRSIAAPAPSISAPAGSGYIWPTTVRRITQYFGWRHTGLDIAGPSGTPIYSARDGVVSRSQCGWNGGYGCYIIIDHGGGIQTLYAHNSQLFVSVGQTVSQGQNIAAMGSTGRSTGPHVHFEVRVNGSRQNPLRYTR